MKRQSRIDQDAWEAEWPMLFDDGPSDLMAFGLRNAEILVPLDGLDVEEMARFAAYFRVSPSGFLLLVIFEFVHGSYLLHKMRRERSGLFLGFPANDPSPWSSFAVDKRGCAAVAAPAQLVADLGKLAATQGLDASHLTGRIVQRYLDGHLALDDWPRPSTQE